MHTEDKQQVQTSLQNIITAVDRASHLINQLLTIARLSEDNPLADIKSYALEEIAATTIADLIPKAHTKNIDIELNINPINLDSTIKCNKIMLEIAIRNLIDNAIKYSPENSLINVSINKNTQEKNQLILSVSDQGYGITDDKKNFIFDRFYRGDTHFAPGSGLGLSIVKLIADLHDAKIIIDNGDNDTGTKFSMIFII